MDDVVPERLPESSLELSVTELSETFPVDDDVSEPPLGRDDVEGLELPLGTKDVESLELALGTEDVKVLELAFGTEDVESLEPALGTEDVETLERDSLASYCDTDTTWPESLGEMLKGTLSEFVR